MVFACLKREPREWRYCLYTWTLWLPSACIPVYCTAAFVMCQVAELMPQPSAKTLAAVLWRSARAAAPDWTKIKCGCRCCSDRERLQVSTVLEKPHPLTTILRRWDLAFLLGLLWASETFSFTRAEWQAETGYSIDVYTLFRKRYCDTCKPWHFFLAKC